MSALFQHGQITLHSGGESDYKIECDALDANDWVGLARIIASRVRFGEVVGVPRGGLALARELGYYATSGPTLIVDDVLTTGASMEEWHTRPDDIGIVVFARGPLPDWVSALFVATPFLEGVASGGGSGTTKET